jgi:S-adenosylmethionine/arginine decarboxylase-like enzyme
LEKRYYERESDLLNTKGQHLIIDAFECDPDILNDAEGLKNFTNRSN